MRSIMSLLVRKLMDARGGKASPYASQVIIIEFVNLVSGTIDRIRRVGENLLEEKKKVDIHRKLTDEQEIL